MRADGAAGAGTRAATAADFLTTLRGEQARFADALRVAQASLPKHDGQLAHLAALQLRLTIQFLDAQRAILTHRAQVDEQVERIQIAYDLPSSEVDGPIDTSRPFSQLDLSSAPRQLTSMLDDWWCAETLDGKAALDAVMHAAGRRSEEPPTDLVDEGTDLLPLAAQVVLTASPGGEDLNALLDALAASMESRAVPDPGAGVASVVPDVDEVLIRLDGPGADERFSRFWEPETVSSGQAAPAVSGGRRATRWTERPVSLAWNR